MPPVYIVIPASSAEDLEKKLQQKYVEGYKALFPLECKNGESVVVLERMPQQGDEPSVYEKRGIRSI